jgi:hypothetical protein
MLIQEDNFIIPIPREIINKAIGYIDNNNKSVLVDTFIVLFT